VNLAAKTTIGGDRRRIACTAKKALLFITAALSSTLAISAGSPPPAEVFASIPRMINVRINPRGDLLAWTDNSGPEQRAVIFDLAARTEKRAIAMGDATTLRGLRWADNETLLLETRITQPLPGRSEGRYLNQNVTWRTFAVDAQGGGTRLLLMEGDRAQINISRLHAWHLPKAKTVIMSTLDTPVPSYLGPTETRVKNKVRDPGWVVTLFEVDTRTGKGVVLERGERGTNDWVIDRNGAAVARGDWDSSDKSYRLLAKRGAGWREVLSQQGESLTLSGLDATGQGIVAMGARGGPRIKVWSIPLDGSQPSVLFDDESGMGVAGLEIDPVTGAPVGAWVGGAIEKVHWFDAKARTRAEALDRSFPGKNVLLLSSSEEGRKVIARVSAPAGPGIYYLVDFDKRTADIVGEDYPALLDAPLGEMLSLTYAARDGVTIPAYLTLPPSTEAKDLPLIILPHASAGARDDYEFDWWARFLASRGYAVLQPQFRGSQGFGEAHRKAGEQWGGLMQDDLSDGVRAMVARGIADPSRVCIVGNHYAGYAALAGAAFTPDLYACAASINGISDLPNMLGYVAGYYGKDSETLVGWRNQIGLRSEPELIRRSPAGAASDVHAKILLMHVEKDTTVPLEQSTIMRSALERAGKPVRFVQLDGDDHWIARSQTRLRVLKELESFLAENLGMPKAQSP